MKIVGRVYEVRGDLAAVDPGAPYAVAWFPWPDRDLAVGDRVVVRVEVGERSADESWQTHLRVVAVEAPGRRERAVPWMPHEPAPAVARPSGPPAWLPLLVRFGLLEPSHALPRRSWRDLPVVTLCRTYGSREVCARGFLHYDHRWRNDTDDVVRDFAEALGVAERLRLVALDDDQLRFEVAQADGTWVTDQVPLDEPLEESFCARLNSWAERLGWPRRVHGWSTGSDELAFLCRPPAEVDEMRAAGLFSGDEVTMSGAPPAGEWEDWSDVKV